jgi:glycosyltransferase involved in cell wall biosynthesis
MRRADICALASEREGLPRVIVQYVLAGRPVVATYLPGVEAVVREGSTGYLVERVSDMADPLIALLSDDALRQQFAAAAASLDLSAWGAGHMAAQLEALYQQQFAARTGNQLSSSAA